MACSVCSRKIQTDEFPLLESMSDFLHIYVLLDNEMSDTHRYSAITHYYIRDITPIMVILLRLRSYS